MNTTRSQRTPSGGILCGRGPGGSWRSVGELRLQLSDIVLWVLGVRGGEPLPGGGHHHGSRAVDQHTQVTCPCPQAGGFCKLSSSMVTASLCHFSGFS